MSLSLPHPVCKNCHAQYITSRVTLWLIGRLRRIEKCRLDPFEDTLVTAISGFLAADAEWSPWHRLQATPADFLVAVHAGAEAVTVNSNQRQLDAVSNRGFASQTGDREFLSDL